MREIQSKWKVGAHNYVGRRRRKTVWRVIVGGVRELAHKHSGPAIPRIQAKTARANKQPSAYSMRTNIHNSGKA